MCFLGGELQIDSKNSNFDILRAPSILYLRVQLTQVINNENNRKCSNIIK